MSEIDAGHPAVSIIIPAYNAGEYIAGCLDSIFRQTRSDFEVIVVDDGSADDTPEVLARYGERDNLIVISQENAGTPVARNRGMDIARGEYLCFIDADDELEPDYLKAMLERAYVTRADVISSGYTLWKDGKLLSAHPAEQWDAQLGGARVSLMCVPTTRLYSARFLREHGIRFTPGERFDVIAFSLMVNMLANGIENVHQNNYRYYMRPKSFTARLRKGQIPADNLPLRALDDAITYLAPRCDHAILEFCVVKILAGVLFENLRRHHVNTVDAFSGFCARVMGETFPKAHKNPYISLFSPKSLPFIQRAAMKSFVIACKLRALRAFARAFTRL